MDTQEQIKQIQEQIDSLQEQLNSLSSSSTIPFEIGEAFKDRIGGSEVIPSSKTVASETQTINEGGIAIVTALDVPDSFGSVLVNGAIKYIPLYD